MAESSIDDLGPNPLPCDFFKGAEFSIGSRKQIRCVKETK